MDDDIGSQASAENIKGSKKERPAVNSQHLTIALQALHATLASYTSSPSSTIHLPAFQAVVHAYLTSKSSNLPKYILSNVKNQITQMTHRSLSDVPPYVHLGRDAAPQLIIDSDQGKLVIKGGMRGYKMARASHGVSSGGCWYYEAIVLDPPKVIDVINALPANVRLGEGVREGLRRGLEEERSRKKVLLDVQNNQTEGKGQDESLSTHLPKKRKVDNIFPDGVKQYGVGGHLRIGWSMRTGELQAPVGYDKWSYGIRDISGSKIHDSKREDKWGGIGFGPGDVIGIAINLTKPSDSSNGEDDGDNISKKNVGHGTNHIRFFKNGNPMGDFVFVRGTKTGGEAFDLINPGTYYPAISLYMGATTRVNFGPHFVYPPRGLPTGMKIRPMSEVCQPPMHPKQIVDLFTKERLFGKKVDDDIIAALMDALETEASMRFNAFKRHLSDHVKVILDLRIERGLNTSDLPDVEESDKDETENMETRGDDEASK